MLKKFRIRLPDKERCTVLGVKFDGQIIRTQLWLMGVASGVSFMSAHLPFEREAVKFNVIFSNNQMFYVETNSQILMDQVADYLRPYGCTVEDFKGSAFGAHMEALNKA